ncbi:MAG: DUF2264 domain-containing protein [Roseiflexaceae bacterium]
MATIANMPPLDYARAPYTGWAREHWVALLARLTYGYVCAAEPYGSPARALYPDDRRGLPDTADALESFARISAAWGAWLHNPANPATLSFAGRELNIELLLRQALLDGTDPSNPHTYWSDIDHMSQQIVECADVALTLWLSRARVFERMSAAERAQIIAWLAQVDGKETWPDNWILFPAMAQTVRHKLGYPAPVAEIDSRLAQIADFYRGDGWYADGPADEFELYNAWMFCWHYLLWAWIDGDRNPDHRRMVLERAQSFLAGFQYFFGANGAYVAWGRSVVYRFAAVSAFATGHLLKIAPNNPGLLRRISSGCLRYFIEHGAIDPDGHFLRQGFHGDFPPAGESYISPGSPSWACHGLFALLFDRDDPFWAATEAPLPVERADFDLALATPGFVLSGRRATGQVLMLNSCSGHAPDVSRPDYVSKYGKFAYSTHFPFNVVPVAGSYGLDAMLALTIDGRSFGHREITRASGAAPAMIWSEFDQLVDGQPQLLRVAVLLWNDVQVRLAFLQPTQPVRAVEAPGALGCDRPAAIVRRSDQAAGWEYAEVDGRALAIRRLWGYDSQAASAPFLGQSNVNLAYRYAEQPTVCEAQPSGATRGLAAASLLRPMAFDPGSELAGIAVTAKTADSFDLTLPDGERAFVALGDTPPRSVQLAGHTIEGQLRIIRIQTDASALCGLGLTRVAGVAELAAPGTLALVRQPDGAVHITTDVGVALAPAWLGGAPGRIEALTLAGEWAEVSQPDATGITSELVAQWSRRNQRKLVTFRIRQ